MDQTYESQTLNSSNPVARFAHRIRHRTSVSLVAKLAPQNGTVLDFGAGTGQFLHALRSARSDLMVAAFEPYMPLSFSDIVRYLSMAEVPDRSVDVLCAFETLEHLEDFEIDAFVASALRVCRGRVVVSVPVMQGLALPLKIVNHAVFRRQTDYSLLDLARGTLGMPVSRTTTRQTSHKGFDHRRLAAQLGRSLRLERRFTAPFPYLPAELNSQSFMVFGLS